MMSILVLKWPLPCKLKGEDLKRTNREILEKKRKLYYLKLENAIIIIVSCF